MKSLTRLALAFVCALVVFPLVAFAQGLPVDPVEGILLHLLEGLQVGNWFLVVPALVWLAVWALRKFGSERIPWLATKTGGIVMALVLALAGAFIETALSGAPWTTTTIVSLVVKTLIAWLTSAGLHTVQKNAREAMTPVTTDAQAGAVLEQAGKGPQP
jgi:hypothetical protein